MSRSSVINGIDVDNLGRIIGQIRENPSLGRAQFRAHHAWISGAHARTEIKDFFVAGEENGSRYRPFVLESGEPEALLGEDEGPNATEALLHALASCLDAAFIYHAAARGIRIEELTLELTGNIDLRGYLGVSDEVRRGFADIEAVFRVKSDAPREKIEELVGLAQKYSPVFDNLANETTVTAKLEIAEAANVR